MKNDQFAVYRVNRNSEGRDLWHLSYQEAVSRKLAIRIEHYRQMDIRPLLPGENAIALWKRMKESCEVSDVIVLNQNGEIHCYYVNEDYPQLLSGFIRLNPSGTLVTLDTENYRISGKPGNWMATDDIIIDGKQFYLMEHQEYHRQVAYIILDSYGKMIMEECQNGFDEKTKQKLHELMKVPEQRKQEHQKYKNRLEHYQKFFENGTYERSWESGIEGNYNMVDGQVNNLKNKKVGVIVVGAARVGSIQYELINKQFQCMAEYLFWDMLFIKSYSASDRADLSNNTDAIAELKELGSNLC